MSLCRILQWEDGYCNFAACSAARNDSRGAQASASFHSKRHNGCDVDLVQLETMNPELFFKMSHEVYNYGEGYIQYSPLLLYPIVSITHALNKIMEFIGCLIPM